MNDVYGIFIKSFVPLFAIMDPFVSVPVFLSLTKGMTPLEKEGMAREAAFVAGGVLFAFLLFGNQIMQYLGISVSSLRVGGGLVLLLMGLQLVLGFKLNEETEGGGHTSAGVIIGTPLITGPGVITTSILLVNQYGNPSGLFSLQGFLAVCAAALTAILLVWLIIKEAKFVQKLLGERGISIFSRVMGLLLTATAVQFMAKGGVFALTP